MRGERAKTFEGLEGKLQRLLKAVTTKAMSKQHMVDGDTQQDLESAAGEQCRLKGKMWSGNCCKHTQG